MKVLSATFFDAHLLAFLHRMVYQWYATYKSVMRYFVSMEIEQLLMREKKVKIENITIPNSSELQLDMEGQQLFIFPDNWTRYTTLPEKYLQNTAFIHLVSTDTQNRKDIHRRTIKKSMTGVITATHSEVFQPYKHLKKIFLIDPHKWYYHNQQDPRYSLVSVVQRMGEEYGAEVKEIKGEEVGKLFH
ncbi:MAG: hypothetical protein LBD75_00255 [Candidatus Peribacteria bacterium]|jgi:hypothetical protein|nr:hypothetical protein [Candidatus Peribacteria bacterium]